MSGETNLQILLKNMQPELLPGEYVFCTVTPEAAGGIVAHAVCCFREQEGTTLILLREEAEKYGLAGHYPARMITLHILPVLRQQGFWRQ